MSNKQVKRSRDKWIRFCDQWAEVLQDSDPEESFNALLWAEWCKTAQPSELRPHVEKWSKWCSAHNIPIDSPRLVRQ